MFDMIFPELKDKVFGYVNLNLEAKIWAKENRIDEKLNPLIDPIVCQNFVDSVHKKYGIDFSYGGWMEDRSYLWRGWYLDKSQMFTHLGVDLNVPFGTQIATDFKAEVVFIMDDYPLDGGWGPYVILKNLEEDVYILYAHLDRNILCKVGARLLAGDTFAKVGKAPENGNWFSHLHVQVIENKYFQDLYKNNSWEKFDGYGLVDDIASNSILHPDPLQFIKLI